MKKYRLLSIKSESYFIGKINVMSQNPTDSIYTKEVDQLVCRFYNPNTDDIRARKVVVHE